MHGLKVRAPPLFSPLSVRPTPYLIAVPLVVRRHEQSALGLSRVPGPAPALVVALYIAVLHAGDLPSAMISAIGTSTVSTAAFAACERDSSTP